MGCVATTKPKTEQTHSNTSHMASQESIQITLRLSKLTKQIIIKKYKLTTIKEERPNLESSQSFK